MIEQGLKGLLIIVVALLLLDLGAQFGRGSAREQTVSNGHVVGLAGAARNADVMYLFRAFDDGRIEGTLIRFSDLQARTSYWCWSALPIGGAATKPSG